MLQDNPVHGAEEPGVGLVGPLKPQHHHRFLVERHPRHRVDERLDLPDDLGAAGLFLLRSLRIAAHTVDELPPGVDERRLPPVHHPGIAQGHERSGRFVVAGLGDARRHDSRRIGGEGRVGRQGGCGACHGRRRYEEVAPCRTVQVEAGRVNRVDLHGQAVRQLVEAGRIGGHERVSHLEQAPDATAGELDGDGGAIVSLDVDQARRTRRRRHQLVGGGADDQRPAAAGHQI